MLAEAGRIVCKEAVLIATGEVIESEGYQLQATGYLGVLATPIPETPDMPTIRATEMYTNIHGVIDD